MTTIKTNSLRRFLVGTALFGGVVTVSFGGMLTIDRIDRQLALLDQQLTLSTSQGAGSSDDMAAILRE